ncbi:MAG: DinB family protein [Bacteroidota bacterium]
MPIKNLVFRLLRYNLWANERLTSWLKSIDREILYTETGSSFATIDLTIQHLLTAQLYWHELITSGRIKDFDFVLKDHAVEEMMNELVKSSQLLIDSFTSFDERQLIEIIKSSDSTQSRYEFILHVVNHSTYHRGQVVSMSRRLGVKGEIPVTDYDGYLWWLGHQ